MNFDEVLTVLVRTGGVAVACREKSIMMLVISSTAEGDKILDAIQ